ncbi:hypothetical protein HPP92_019544 [Vanilla planifolia]|uniref:S1 motif domain-containing protein n=1 Tax=Vanilla planifolia TaxID=51239 RepID=A0A835Q320_VANPL|nr:hypothetical protein HPP92_019544 [Vanilla planifolia]
MADAEDGLKKLEYLSLVSKVCTELESHVGCSDKVLAEFITELGREAESVEEFDAKLKENGAEMPDYFVRTLLTIIHAILPSKSKSKPSSDPSSKKKPSAFPGLSRADNRERIKELEREIEEDSQIKADEKSKLLDREDGRSRDRNCDYRREGDWIRDRRGHRDHDHWYDRDQDRDVDDRDRDRYRERDRDRDRDRGRERDRGRDRDRGRTHRRDDHRDNKSYSDVDEDDDGNRDGRGHGYTGRTFDEPELYHVYKGKVSRLMDNGCFVDLVDFRGKEGLVHVSQIANRRVTNAKDEVKRGQDVFVKVISVWGRS